MVTSYNHAHTPFSLLPPQPICTIMGFMDALPPPQMDLDRIMTPEEVEEIVEGTLATLPPSLHTPFLEGLADILSRK